MAAAWGVIVALNVAVAVTDNDWFFRLREQSRAQKLDEVNFWSPSSGGNFGSKLAPGELFLFKLHAPNNYIVGGGFFSHMTKIPCSLAWDAFGLANGAGTHAEMRKRIIKYRRNDDEKGDFTIGCRTLTQPFFLEKNQWLQLPSGWKPNIVTGKFYQTDAPEIADLWFRIIELMNMPSGLHAANPMLRYGEPRLIAPRLGQGAFRLAITDSYNRRCAVTKTKTLPVLQAAHIKPYSEGGVHETNNGILLRSDVHNLFDQGYVTVTDDMHFEVSKKIKEEFHNGDEYYAMHGNKINLPHKPPDQPDKHLLQWHNENIYMG